MNKYEVEVTDTFGGEANYCWVRRYQIEGDTDRQLVRRAKAAAGWNGLRCETSSFGDVIEIRPKGMCQVMFITWMGEQP